MSARFFLDTNVFIYQFDEHSPKKAGIASQLIDDAISTKKGVVSYQVVQEFLRVAFTKFAKPLAPSEAEEYFFKALNPILFVHSSPRLFLEAIAVRSQHRFSWYDSLIVAAAQQAECSILYTEDMQHGRRIGRMKIVDPFR